MERPPRDTRNTRRGASSALAVVTVALVCALAAAAAAARPVSGAKALAAHPHGHSAHVCGPVNPHFARCDADVVTDSSGTPFVSSAPAGYGPSDLLSAYALASAAAQNGSGETVAIVDAYDDPNAEADLGVYRSQYGLSACTTANGCFREVNQTGGTTYPKGNTGWSEEISLDLDMVSAICPRCNILLVEATNNRLANLAAAVDEAATLGATQISNSYGGSEYSTETSDQSHYNHPGIAITASSGDNGYGVEFPAASQYVTAVGGTSLTTSSDARGWTETAWSGAGSGCSAYVTKPSWQKDTGCSRRTVADVSADADPNTGVAVYDTDGESGWLVFGGTSVASPIIASYYALVGPAAGTGYGSWAYNHTSMFNDVTSGSNGSCSGSYLCTAETGYDGPTGIGTPEGIPLAPTVTTGSSSGVGTTSAAVAGTVNPNGQSTTYHFDYGTSTSYGSQAPAAPDPSAGSGTTSQNESASLTGLTPGKIYHYRIEATNATGTTYGSDGTFTTTTAAPSVSGSPSSVSAGGSVAVSWSGVASPTSHDWVAVYQLGAANTSWIDWIYDDSCTQAAGSTSLASGSCSFTMPATAGTYEFRLLADDSYTVLATSNQVTVTGGSTPSVSGSPSSAALVRASEHPESLGLARALDYQTGCRRGWGGVTCLGVDF
jgi:subtilase family serine protease